MEYFNNHKKLFWTAFLFFLGLTILVAILPALNNQKKNKPLPDEVPLSARAVKGKNLYIANGCVACHTQQVRNGIQAIDTLQAGATRGTQHQAGCCKDPGRP